MVGNRCQLVVSQLLADYKIPVKEVTLGRAILEKELQKEQVPVLKEKLFQFGYELIDDKRAKITAGVKSLLLDILEGEPVDEQYKMSVYLSQRLQYEYHYLSALFSEIEGIFFFFLGISIEKYFILLKIEKVKDLIEYGELSLSAIAYKMGYSSPAHMTHQFKQVTSMTPTHFKMLIMNYNKIKK